MRILTRLLTRSGTSSSRCGHRSHLQWRTSSAHKLDAGSGLVLTNRAIKYVLLDQQPHLVGFYKNKATNLTRYKNTIDTTSTGYLVAYTASFTLQVVIHIVIRARIGGSTTSFCSHLWSLLLLDYWKPRRTISMTLRDMSDLINFVVFFFCFIQL